VIVNVESTYEVEENEKIQMFINREIFRIPIDKNISAFIFLHNKTEEIMKVTSFSGFGDYLQINYPKDFKDKDQI